MSLNDNLLNLDSDIDMLIRPFAFIYKCCKDIKYLNHLRKDHLRSNETDPNYLTSILAKQKLKTIQIMARLKKDNSFWGNGDEDMNNIDANELVEKKKFIKKRLEKLMNNNDELIYTNAALSYLYIGSFEFQHNEWPSFFIDNTRFIINFLEQYSNNPKIKIEPKILASLCILEYGIENKFLTSSCKLIDDKYIDDIWNIFQKFLKVRKSFDDNEEYNEEEEGREKKEEDKKKKEERRLKIEENRNQNILLLQCRKRCFSIIKAAIPLLNKLISTPAVCSQLIDLLLNADRFFNSEVYNILILLYQYYYFAAADHIQPIFNFTIKDLRSNQNKYIISALNFWISMSEIESNILKMQKCRTLCFTQGAYPIIITYLFNILEKIDLEKKDDLLYDDQPILEESAIECISCFSRCEPKVDLRNKLLDKFIILFENHGFLRGQEIQNLLKAEENKKRMANNNKSLENEIKEKIKRIKAEKKEIDLKHYVGIKILSVTMKIFNYNDIYHYFTPILECVSNENKKLATTSLSLVYKIVKYFTNKLKLSDVNDIVEMCKNNLKYPKSYKILSKLIEAFKISMNSKTGKEGFVNYKADIENGNEIYKNIKQAILKSYQKNISNSFPAVIALIENSNSKDDANDLEDLFLNVFNRFIKNMKNNLKNKKKVEEEEEEEEEEEKENESKEAKNENEEVKNENENENEEVSNENEEEESDDDDRKDADFQTNSDLCQILKRCIICLRNIKDDDIFQLLYYIIRSFGNNFDESLLELASSIIPCLYEHKNEEFVAQLIQFFDKIMNIIKKLFFDTDNDQRIELAADFVADLTNSKPEEINYEYLKKKEIFDAYERILTSQSILISSHAPVISSIADIIMSLKNDSKPICTQFNKIFENFVSLPINDIEYANDLYEALCRSYTAMTNLIKDSPETFDDITNTVLELFKKIHILKIEKRNHLIPQFVVRIIYNLYTLDDRASNKISFLAQSPSVKEILNEALNVVDQTVEFRKKVQTFVYTLYPND